MPFSAGYGHDYKIMKIKDLLGTVKHGEKPETVNETW
jgi:hypothetical protein